MTILKWIWEGSGSSYGRPAHVFWTLRLLMFAVSFVLEDWAIHELVEDKRQRQRAILLVASSYVTWTWQSHTFSNALETLIVLWSLVLIQRLREHKAYPLEPLSFKQALTVRFRIHGLPFIIQPYWASYLSLVSSIVSHFPLSSFFLWRNCFQHC